MLSVNAPVPPRVRALADELAPALAPFASVREDPTLVVKRLDAGAPGADGGRGGPSARGSDDDGSGGGAHADHLVDRAREALRGALACEARVARVGAFTDPPAGPAPVVYLAVESPGLGRLHGRLCGSFDPAPGIEGEDYVPHVTLARGGDRADAEALAGRAVGPVEWTVDRLEFHDARHGERAGTVSLPA